MSDFRIKNGVLEKYRGSGGNVIIPMGVTSIDDFAFSGCSGLTSVTIPDSVIHVGFNAFKDCEKLKVEILMRYFHVISGILIKYSGPGGDVEIPSEVRVIGGSAFDHCSSLTNVTIPDSVTSIDEDAFRYCSSLISVTIPESVTSIGRGTFVGCSNLTNLTIPNSVKSIGNFAFVNCSSLTSMTIPNSVTSIGEGLFESCSSLRSVTIPDGMTSISEGLFKNCSGLTSVMIPNSVTSIGNDAFAGCSGLTSVMIPDGVTSIGYSAFSGCSKLTRVTIPDGVTSIGHSAFSGCSKLTRVTIPDGVTSIGHYAFAGCSKLTRVTIPDSVTSIGYCAFYRCKELEEVNFKKKYPKLDNETFDPHKPDFPMEDLQTTNNIPVALIDNFLPVDIEKKRPYLLLFQTSKGWKQRVRADVTEKNADTIVNNTIALIQEFPKLLKRAALQAAEFALEYQTCVRAETFRSLLNVLEEKNCLEAVAALRKDPGLRAKLEDGQPRTAQEQLLDPIEKVVQEHWIYDDATNKVSSGIEYLVRSGSVLPHYTGSEQLASSAALTYVIAAYARQTIKAPNSISYKIDGYLPLKADNVADQIAAALNGEELLTFLEEGIYRQRIDETAFLFIPALARYADESRTAKLISKMKEWENWNKYTRRGRESIMIAHSALMLNDSRSAMLHMEKAGQLDAYAKLRGTDAQTLRDSIMVDFGLNEDGRKSYDLGNKIVSAFVGHDLKVRLYDEAETKEVKSLPKRGSDPDKYSAASKDLAEMKKSVKKVVTARNNQLFKDFLSGKTVSAASWKKAYLDNPILYRVAELLVWYQGTESFILNQDGPIRNDGTRYEITEEEICVAHPMEMDPQSVKAWQQYFTSHALRQPFEQIWEPVIDPETIQPDRYRGQKVSVFHFRNQVKHGIYFLDENFHGDISFYCLGCDLEGIRTKETAWRHEIGPDETFTLGKFSCDNGYSRQVNHIVSLLDRWTVTGRLLKDDVSVRNQLDSFTVAQIMGFIRLTSENNCPNCTAMLLQYKQEHYPEFDPMAEFTLE